MRVAAGPTLAAARSIAQICWRVDMALNYPHFPRLIWRMVITSALTVCLQPASSGNRAS